MTQTVCVYGSTVGNVLLMLQNVLLMLLMPSLLPGAAIRCYVIATSWLWGATPLAQHTSGPRRRLSARWQYQRWERLCRP